MEDMISEIRRKKPHIHNITNYVTVNDCANIMLAIGASPIMADDEAEVGEIVSLCDALVINIGTLNRRTVKAMIIAGKTANQKEIPVILDPVGNGASALRTDTTNRLLEEVRFSAIRGNVSEIKMACCGISGAKGVDADEQDIADSADILSVAEMAKRFSGETGAVIAVTGQTDVIADGKTAFAIHNGNAAMSRITGTGCMCSALVGSCCGITRAYLDAAVCAVSMMGLAGEMAFDKASQMQAGTNSMRMYIIDAISNMTDQILARGKKIETL